MALLSFSLTEHVKYTRNPRPANCPMCKHQEIHINRGENAELIHHIIHINQPKPKEQRKKSEQFTHIHTVWIVLGVDVERQRKDSEKNDANIERQTHDDIMPVTVSSLSIAQLTPHRLRDETSERERRKDNGYNVEREKHDYKIWS